jgi:hypothetical protein
MLRTYCYDGAWRVFQRSSWKLGMPVSREILLSHPGRKLAEPGTLSPTLGLPPRQYKDWDQVSSKEISEAGIH